MAIAKKTIKKTAAKSSADKKAVKETAVKIAATEKPKKPAVKKATVKKKPAAKKTASDIFAVIQTGGKQYIVRPGETLEIEKIKKPARGDAVVFEEVLLVFDGKEVKIGAPYVKGAKVTAQIEGDVRAKKVTVIRYKSKTRQFKKKGHRQTHTQITITEIK